ncbi:hypothetical protein RRG08_001476 [Elysia crispata]|uniref:PiggyBac transposable element-derived protein domain-containing protein n=1 Tax=Elysia crispata TaxID=231223 RepID=A0AAE1B1C2_9GAST|nr:hypothetical protein RRG08_001476 [Elysia crispata]
MVETDVGEMKTFIGLCLLMGVIKKPDYNSYWSTDQQIPYSDSCLFCCNAAGQISSPVEVLAHKRQQKPSPLLMNLEETVFFRSDSTRSPL